MRIFPVQFAIYFRPTPSFCCGSRSSPTSSFHWPKGFDSPGENPNEPQINRLGGLRISWKVNYLLLVIPVGSVIRVICLPFAIKSTLQWGRRTHSPSVVTLPWVATASPRDFPCDRGNLRGQDEWQLDHIRLMDTDHRTPRDGWKTWQRRHQRRVGFLPITREDTGWR